MTRGHDVYVALRPNSAVIHELKCVPRENIFTLPLRNSLDAASARSLATLVRTNQIQIVHTHMARDYPSAAYAARRNPCARGRSLRVMSSPHKTVCTNYTFESRASDCGNRSGSSSAKGQAIVATEKISIVLNGIDTTRFAITRTSSDRSEFRKSWKLLSECLLVSTVAELTRSRVREEFLRGLTSVEKNTQLPISSLPDRSLTRRETSAATGAVD